MEAIKTIQDAKITELLTLIKAFEAVQQEYARFGAEDSEPDWEFQNALRKAFHGVNDVPKSAEQWELCTASLDCDEAAAALTAACQKVCDYILATPLSAVGEVRAVLNGACWRVDLDLRVT